MKKTGNEMTRQADALPGTLKVLLAYLDPKFNFINVNQAYAEADGRTSSFFVGKNHFDLYPDEENEAIFREVVKTGEPFTAYQRPFVYPNNPERGVDYWDWTLSPIKDRAGQVTGLLLRAVNVTERVLAAEELRKGEANFRRLFDESPLGAAFVGLDYRYQRVNEEFCRITGYSAEELISKTILDITHPDDLTETREQASALIAGEIDRYRIEKRYVRKDGSVVWVRLWARLLRDKDGKPLYYLPLIQDITQERQAEQKLRDYRERLEKLVEERTAQLAETNTRLQLEIIEHERAHEQQLEANDELTNILSSISDGFFTLNDELVVTYFNKAAEQLLGIKAASIVGRNLLDVFSEARGTVFEENYTRALREKIPLSFEAYFEPHKNWYDVRVYPYRDGISIYFQITNARKQAEAALRENEEKLRLITDSLPVLISYVDSDQRYQFNNRAYEEWFGQSPDELNGKHLREVLGDAAYEGIRRHIEAALSGVPVKFEEIVDYKDAGQRYVEASYIPHIDREGQVQGFFALITDVHERKSAEIELQRLRDEAQEERDRLMTLVNTVSDEIWFCDKEGNVALLNSVAEKGGFSPEDVNLPLSQWVPTLEILNVDGRPRSVEDSPLMRSLRGETVRYFEEIIRIPRTGLLQYREGSSTPLRNKDGQIVGAIAAIRDVTDAKRAEIALRESEARYRELSEHLEQKVKEKVAELKQAERLATIGQMVSVVAHEVRNPLQNISMGVDMLKMAPNGPDTADILEEIAYGVNTLSGIVGELLNYARPLKLQLAPVRIDELIHQAFSMLEQKLAHISVSRFDKVDRQVLVDRTKLVQVLVNLLSNAADAMPDGGNLTIHAAVAGKNGTLHLSISDTGQGIDPQNMEKIFEPFFTTKTRGTGLGLPVCKKIIEAHHGKIRITSKVGKGTTAEIELPLSGS